MIYYDDKVKVKWTGHNRKHYEQFGYKYTKQFDEIEVLVKELTPNSHVEIRCKCDWCNKEIIKKYGHVNKFKNQFCN